MKVLNIKYLESVQQIARVHLPSTPTEDTFERNFWSKFVIAVRGNLRKAVSHKSFSWWVSM